MEELYHWTKHGDLNVIVNKLVEREAFLDPVRVKSAVYIYHTYFKGLLFFSVSLLWLSLTFDTSTEKKQLVYTQVQ